MSQVANSPAQAGRGPEVPPVRARSGRRPLPPLVFLAVLAVAAAAVWVYVLRSDGGQGTSNVACTTAPTDLAPSSVTVHVLNATSKQGQATTVAKDLQSRGFQVGAPDNDRSGRTVSGVGEIRHGARGKEAAALLAAYLPGATDYQDTRATGTVDLVIGPAYEKLATPDQVTAALRAPSC